MKDRSDTSRMEIFYCRDNNSSQYTLRYVYSHSYCLEIVPFFFINMTYCNTGLKIFNLTLCLTLQHLYNTAERQMWSVITPHKKYHHKQNRFKFKPLAVTLLFFN